MKFSFYSFFSIAVAIFSMYFGAGNLIYPVIIGRDSGDLLPIGFFGFFLSGICIPVLGIVSMVLFQGKYEAFFHRIGKKVGDFFIFCCMMVIGPLIAIPRIVTLSHIMLAPLFGSTFLGTINYASALCFAFLFLGLTFFATYQERKIVDLLGFFVGPALLLSLCVIIIQGLLVPPTNMIIPSEAPFSLFFKTFFLGYGTLDLIASIFFSSAIGVLLEKMKPGITVKEKIWYIIVCGGSGVALLAVVYCGLSIVGMLHGGNFVFCNAGDLFRNITLLLLGKAGVFITGVAVFFACISTVIALAVVLAEYTKTVIAQNHISHTTSLLLVLFASVPLSIAGLDQILYLSAGPLLCIGYPTLIMLTVCNILYKVVGFKPVKVPVLVVFLLSICLYLWMFFTT